MIHEGVSVNRVVRSASPSQNRKWRSKQLIDSGFSANHFVLHDTTEEVNCKKSAAEVGIDLLQLVG